MVATPSGISLAPEGGAHQSVITPGIGVTLPDLAYYEPAFAREVEWILLAGLRAVAERRESLYLRSDHRPGRPAPGSGADRRATGRPCWPVATGSSTRAAGRGGMPRRRRAPLRRRRDGPAGGGGGPPARASAAPSPSVFVVTSPDRLYRGLRDPRPYLETLVGADEEDVPVVSVLDGHSHALAFLGGALGVSQLALGVDGFGQSGTRPRALSALRHRRRRARRGGRHAAGWVVAVYFEHRMVTLTA